MNLLLPYRYAKAGVMLVDLQSKDVQQCEFDWSDVAPELGEGAGQLVVNAATPRDRTLLMATLDDINQRFGRGALHLASSGLYGERPWSMRQERRTPRYTTNWHEMPVVRA